jgi:hypothetical protein
VLDIKIFAKPAPTLHVINGGFVFSESDGDKIHWISDFADPDVFKFARFDNCAQEEIIAITHPQCYHLAPVFKDQLSFLHIGTNPPEATSPHYSALLLKGIWHLGDFDPTKTTSNLKTIYGNNFKEAKIDDIKSCLTAVQKPTKSYIVAFAAPPFVPIKQNKPYSIEDLKEMYLKAYTAFHGAKQAAESQGKKVALHLGNWATGVSGIHPFISHILQLAAARAAQIDYIYFYPMDCKADFEKASAFLKESQQHTNCTAALFLQLVKNRADTDKLVFKATNKT